jgi:DNA polymerase II small subunit
MSENILRLFLEKGFLLDRDMLNFLQDLDDESVAKEIINKIAVVSQKKLITRNLVGENIEKIQPFLFQLEDDKKKLVEKYFVNVSVSVEVRKESEVVGSDSFDIEKSEVNGVGTTNENSFNSEGKCEKGSVKIISSPVIAAQKLTVKDFVKHFRTRYNFMKNILQQRQELESLTSIDKISGNNRNFSIIGIVSSKQITKNKNLIMEVEDLTGKVKILIGQAKEELFEKSKEILLDDIIGFNVSGTREFLYVNDFFYPDCFVKEKNRTEEEVYALFTSDIHLGSGNFLEKNFEKFISWLNSEDNDLVDKIKYLFVVGDSIDGVGIYPGQEKDLKIKDIKEQYVRLAEFYKKIPKHIIIIQCAGQHDAVRVAEPQPPIGEDFGEPLHQIDNLCLVSNPSLIEIEGNENKNGIKVLMYHGASMHGVIGEIEELRLSNAHSTPAKVVKHLLLRRHLAPSHGATVYIPSKEEDSMLIKEVPDIVITGDLHKTDIENYNGVLIISNSCWQSMTAFEEKVGNQPDPCKVPLLNLQSGAIKILDFSEADSRPPAREGDDGSVKVEKDCSVKDEEMVCEVKNE